MRGHLSAKAHAEEVAFVRGELAKSDAPHWREFLAAWPEK
jgi:hypothetical protein